jgi:hypothetical protein
MPDRGDSVIGHTELEYPKVSVIFSICNQEITEDSSGFSPSRFRKLGGLKRQIASEPVTSQQNHESYEVVETDKL